MFFFLFEPYVSVTVLTQYKRGLFCTALCSWITNLTRLRYYKIVLNSFKQKKQKASFWEIVKRTYRVLSLAEPLHAIGDWFQTRDICLSAFRDFYYLYNISVSVTRGALLIYWLRRYKKFCNLIFEYYKERYLWGDIRDSMFSCIVIVVKCIYYVI